MRNELLNSHYRLAIGGVACLLFFGCGRSNAPTKVPLARESLTVALESWKAGQPSTALRERSPAITMVDEAWQKGEKLESFETVAGELDDGVNLHCPVKLGLIDERGGRHSEQVTYVIGTAPVITIIRDLGPED
jgi:hypothetical protein